MKKKLFMIALVAILALSAFAGCTKKEETVTPPVEEPAVETETPPTTEEKPVIRVGLIKGPTAMGAALFMQEAKEGVVIGNYEFTVFNTPDEVVGKLIAGEIDAASVPANMASVLYHKTNGEILTAAINTLGNLYIVEKGEDVKTVADLSGKTVLVSGQGSVPEYVFQYILNKAGVTDCTVEYAKSHAEAATAVAGGVVDFALLPEPFVSVATGKNADIRVALDVAKEWDAYSYEEENVANTLPMGCIVVRRDFVEGNEKAFNKFLDESDHFIEATNADPDLAAENIVKYGILDSAEIAKKAIPGSNMMYIEGSKMLRLMENFLFIMHEANPQSVGGELVGEDMYYVRQY